MAYIRTCVQKLGAIRRPVRKTCLSSLIIDSMDQIKDSYNYMSMFIISESIQTGTIDMGLAAG